MSTELNETEANKLFLEMSQAIRDDDTLKLTSLTTDNALEEEKVEQPLSDDKPDEDQPEEEDEEEISPQEEEDPADKSDEDEDDDKPEGEVDELKALKEKLAKLEKDNHSLRSAAGRVPHVQRRMRELDKKLEELERKQASPSSQLSEAVQSKIKDALKDIRGTDAELADAVAAAIASATEVVERESITREKDNLTLLRNQDAYDHREYEAERLLDMYPNAPEVFQSEHWKLWKEEQSAGIRGLASSDSADEVALALEKYAKDMMARYPELTKGGEEKPASSVGTPDPAAAEKARQIEAERQRKKSTAANVGSPSAAGKIAVPDDPQALFNKFYKDIKKSSGR